MALAESSETRHFSIRLEGQDEYPPLRDVSSLLYDLNLVYEISRLATDPKYRDYQFSQAVWYRRQKRLVEQDRLHVSTLVFGSPLILMMVLAATPGAVASIWGLLQIAEKIKDRPLDREIKELGRDKLVLEKAKLERELTQNDLPMLNPEKFTETLESRNALRYYDASIKRISANEVQIQTIQVDVLQALPPKPRDLEP